jgi:signal transduction histidine kinase
LKNLYEILKIPQYKKFVNIFIVVCTVLLIGATIELSTSYYSEIHKAQKEADKLTRVLSTQTASVFSKADYIMRGVAEDLSRKEKLSDWSAKELKSIVADKVINVPEVRNFLLINPDGINLLSERKGPPVNLSDRDYFYKQKLSQDDVLIFSEPLVSRINNERILVISRRITNQKKEFIGVTAITIPLKYFSDFYAYLELDPGASITLNSADNILYSRFPWAENFVGKTLANQDAIKKLYQEGENVFFSEKKSRIDGVVRLSSSRKIDSYGFFIVVAFSKDLYMSSWKTKLLIYLCGLSFLAIISFIYLINLLRSLYELDEQRKVAVQTTKLTALGEMAGGVAHEINNPLTIITVRCEQLLKNIENETVDIDSFKNSLEKINQTADRIAKIVKGLKAFSRNSEKDPMGPMPVKEVLENTIELCRDKFRLGGIKLSVERVPEVEISCRESQIVQVLLNLLSNAYDAVELLEAKWVNVSVVAKNDKVLISVTDSGKGIPVEVAENIMRPFFTTKPVGKGTGLGLSISKEIIRDHKGALYIKKDSEHTCFVVDLPRYASFENS